MWPSPFLSYIRKMCDSNFAMSDSGKQACIISLKFRFVILPSGCFSKKFSYWSSIWPLEIEVFLTMYSKSSSDNSRFLLLTERKFPLKSRIFVQNARPIFFSDILENIWKMNVIFQFVYRNYRTQPCFAVGNSNWPIACCRWKNTETRCDSGRVQTEL